MLQEIALIVIVIGLGSAVSFLWHRNKPASLIVAAAGVWLVIWLQKVCHISTKYPLDL
jgi:hypothetical protein